MRFNVHDIIRFDITTSSPYRGHYLADYYRQFLSKEDDPPDFEVSMSDFAPEVKGCMVIGGKYYVKDNYVFCEDRHKVVQWRFSLTDVGSRARISFNGGTYSDRFLREDIIDAMLAFGMTEKGGCLLHASGVSIGQNAFVFAGTQHAGKTSTILNLLADNPRIGYLGNDAILLSAKGQAYDFPVPLQVYPYNLQAVPRLSTMLSSRQKLRLTMNDIILRVTNRYLSFPLDVQPEDLFEVESNHYGLRALFFLTSSTNDCPRVIENGSVDEIIEKLILNNRIEMRYLDRCLRAYSVGNPEFDVDRHWRGLRNVLASILSHTAVFEVILPRQYSKTGYLMISNVIASLL
jgi:hypothetical protein